MPIKYQKDREMILDCKRDNSYMVIDVPANGALFLDKVGSRFEILFPDLAKAYRQWCMTENMLPGVYKYIEKDGYKFIIICSRWSDFGDMVRLDCDTLSYNNIALALREIRDEFGENAKFVSGFLGRRQKAWPLLHREVHSMFNHWEIYPL